MADVKLAGQDDATYTYVATINRMAINRHIALKSGTAKSMRVKIHSANIHVKICVYSDNAGSPNALIASSGSITTAEGYNTINFTTPFAVVKDTYYWIGFNSDTTDVWLELTGGTGYYKDLTYSNDFPDPLTGASSTTKLYALALWGEENAGNPHYAYIQQ